MATTSDIRKGLCINYNNDIYKIIEFLHVKPGKGPAFVRTKLKSLSNGKVIDNTFSAGHKIDDVRVETRKFQFLYSMNILLKHQILSFLDPLSKFDLIKNSHLKIL